MADKQQYPTSEDWKALDSKMKQANSGDKKAISWLRDFLSRNPHVWQRIGDLAAVAERAWTDMIANGDALSAQAIRRQLEAMRIELSEGSSTIMERLMVDSILATWLEVTFLRSLDANGRDRSVTQASLLIKRQESAQKRHHAALKDLMAFRKLLPNRHSVPELKVYRGPQSA